MQWLLFGLLGGFAFVFLTRLFWADNPKNTGSPLVKAAIVVLALTLLLLVVTGRTHWLGAALAGAIPFLRRAAGLVRFAPALAQVWQQLRKRGSNQHHERATGNKSPASVDLTVTQARALLDVTADATPEEIIKAHRRLIARNHPDKGGSTYIAAQLNAAKELLLKA